jgi:class 3 adenylate cyclase/tetratricopeptide (TPR) repeat protein
MFTDIAGYSAKMGSEEATTVRVVREHRTIVRDALAEHSGDERRTVGDAFLVVFESALHAVQCAVAIQERLARRNATQPESEQVWLRIGVHLGEVVLGAEGEIYGDAVNIAARVQPLSPIGGLTISETVLAQIRAHGAWTFEDIGTVPLKNITHPPRLYSTVIGAPKTKASIRVPRWLIGAVAIGAFGASVSYAAIRLRPAPEDLASTVPAAQAAYAEAWEAQCAGDQPRAERLLAHAAEKDPKSWRIAFLRSLLASDQRVDEEQRALAVRNAPAGAAGDVVRLYDRAREEIDSPAVAEAWDAWLAAHPGDQMGQFAAAVTYPLHGHEGLSVNEGQPHDHGSTKQSRLYVERFPDDLGARLYLAGREYDDRHRDLAAAQLDYVLAHCASSCAVARRTEGELALADRRWDDAATAFRKALDLDPTVPFVRDRLADLALFRGDEQERVRRVDALLSDDGPSSQKTGFIYSHGVSLMSLGRRKDADVLFQHFLELATDDPMASMATDWVAVQTAMSLCEPAQGAAALAHIVQTTLLPEVPSGVRDAIAVQALDLESQLAFLGHDDRKVMDLDARLRALSEDRFVEASREGILRNSESRVKAVTGDPEGAERNERMYFPGCWPSRSIARYYERAGNVERAVEAWREVLADSYCRDIPAYVEAHLGLGEAALRAGDLSATKAHSSAARAYWPNPDDDLAFTKRLLALEAATSVTSSPSMSQR